MSVNISACVYPNVQRRQNLEKVKNTISYSLGKTVENCKNQETWHGIEKVLEYSVVPKVPKIEKHDFLVFSKNTQVWNTHTNLQPTLIVFLFIKNQTTSGTLRISWSHHGPRTNTEHTSVQSVSPHGCFSIPNRTTAAITRVEHPPISAQGWIIINSAPSHRRAFFHKTIHWRLPRPKPLLFHCSLAKNWNILNKTSCGALWRYAALFFCLVHLKKRRFWPYVAVRGAFFLKNKIIFSKNSLGRSVDYVALIFWKNAKTYFFKKPAVALCGANFFEQTQKFCTFSKNSLWRYAALHFFQNNSKNVFFQKTRCGAIVALFFSNS